MAVVIEVVSAIGNGLWLQGTRHTLFTRCRYTLHVRCVHTLTAHTAHTIQNILNSDSKIHSPDDTKVE